MHQRDRTSLCLLLLRLHAPFLSRVDGRRECGNVEDGDVSHPLREFCLPSIDKQQAGIEWQRE